MIWLRIGWRGWHMDIRIAVAVLASFLGTISFPHGEATAQTNACYDLFTFDPRPGKGLNTEPWKSYCSTSYEAAADDCEEALNVFADGSKCVKGNSVSFGPATPATAETKALRRELHTKLGWAAPDFPPPPPPPSPPAPPKTVEKTRSCYQLFKLTGALDTHPRERFARLTVTPHVLRPLSRRTTISNVSTSLAKRCSLRRQENKPTLVAICCHSDRTVRKLRSAALSPKTRAIVKRTAAMQGPFRARGVGVAGQDSA